MRALTIGLKRIFGPARFARWPGPFSLGVRARGKIGAVSRKPRVGLRKRRLLPSAVRSCGRCQRFRESVSDCPAAIRKRIKGSNPLLAFYTQSFFRLRKRKGDQSTFC